jgi:ABC-type transport system substrate-binding protein
MSRWDVARSIAPPSAATATVQRKQDYCQAEKEIWQDAPLIWLHTQKLPVVTTKQVSGVVTLPNEQFSTVYASPAST